MNHRPKPPSCEPDPDEHPDDSELDKIPDIPPRPPVKEPEEKAPASH